jgi:hypothetical protein
MTVVFSKATDSMHYVCLCNICPSKKAEKLEKEILFVQVVMRRDEGWVYSILPPGSAAAKIGDKSLKTS